MPCSMLAYEQFTCRMSPREYKDFYKYSPPKRSPEYVSGLMTAVTSGVRGGGVMPLQCPRMPVRAVGRVEKKSRRPRVRARRWRPRAGRRSRPERSSRRRAGLRSIGKGGGGPEPCPFPGAGAKNMFLFSRTRRAGSRGTARAWPAAGPGTSHPLSGCTAARPARSCRRRAARSACRHRSGRAASSRCTSRA